MLPTRKELLAEAQAVMEGLAGVMPCPQCNNPMKSVVWREAFYLDPLDGQAPEIYGWYCNEIGCHMIVNREGDIVTSGRPKIVRLV